MTYQQEYYARNKERIAVRVKAWRLANPGARAEESRRRRERHPERVREGIRRWAEANRERKAETNRRWAEANPDRVREKGRKHASKRRAQMRALPAEEVDPNVVFERDAGICGICQRAVDPTSWHVDHIVPLARGGPHLYANVQLAHPECNWKKGAR